MAFAGYGYLVEQRAGRVRHLVTCMHPPTHASLQLPFVWLCRQAQEQLHQPLALGGDSGNLDQVRA